MQPDAFRELVDRSQARDQAAASAIGCDRLRTLVGWHVLTAEERRTSELDFGKIVFCLVARHVAFGESLQPYLWIASELREVFRHEATHPTQAPDGCLADWPAAVAYLIERQQHSFHASRPVAQVPTLRAPLALGRAARTMIEAGFQVEIEGWDAQVAEADWPRLEASIADEVSAIGGKRLLDHVFRSIRHLRNPKTDRYHLDQIADGPVADDDSERPRPWGYLVALALEHIHSPGRALSDSQLRRSINLISAAVAVFDVVRLSAYQAMFMARDGLMRYLRDATSFDSLYLLSQLPPSHAKTIYHGVFTDQQKGKGHSSLRLGRVIQVADAIMCLAAPFEVALVSIRSVACQAKLGLQATRDVINTAFAGTSNERHHALGYPPRRLSSDATEKTPLFKGHGCGPDEFLMLPAPLSARTTLEAVFAFARLIDRHSDESIGRRAETLLAAAFQRSGHSVVRGAYDLRSSKKSNDTHLQGDCDLVVVSPEHVVFLEMKKKALTARSRLGEDVNILVDLAKSLVHSQSQALQHQAHLQSQAPLVITNEEGEPHRLSLDGRKVLRISVSLLEFGSLHDTISFRKFLAYGCGVRFDHPDEDRMNELAKVGEHFEALRKMTIHAGVPWNGDHDPFGQSLFLPLPYLLHLLNRTQGNIHSFFETLRHLRLIVTETRDVYAHPLTLERL